MRVLVGILTLFIIYSCGQSDEAIKQKYLEKGNEVASATQKELLKNVAQAIKIGGPEYAVEFCNLKALVLTDSLSKMYNCQIKRISNKYRNPSDMPQSKTEIEQLNQYSKAFLEDKPLETNVLLLEDKIEYYKPIMVAKDACLKCHGEPNKDISSETLVKINERYPNDRATGYALNDFRGAWKITFSK
jgi:hypothetical protein